VLYLVVRRVVAWLALSGAQVVGLGHPE